MGDALPVTALLVFQVQLASNPVLDAWYGARDWALDHLDNEDVWITRKDYEEKGEATSGSTVPPTCTSPSTCPGRLRAL